MRIIILFLLTINIVLAQSLRPGSVQGWHLNKTAKDTIRAVAHDTSTVLRSEISDSLSFKNRNINNVSFVEAKNRPYFNAIGTIANQEVEYGDLINHNDTLIHIYTTTSDDNKIYKIISVDGGLTWSSPSVLLSRTESPAGSHMLASGLCITSSGTWITGYHVWDNSTSETYGFYFRRSTDGGVTWGSEIPMTYRYHVQFTGNIIQLSDGSIITCAYDGTGGGLSPDTTWLNVYKSTDDGASWTSNAVYYCDSDTPRFDQPMMDEPTIAADSNDSLIIIGRAQGTFGTFVLKSSDKGATWSKVGYIGQTLSRAGGGGLANANSGLITSGDNFIVAIGHRTDGGSPKKGFFHLLTTTYSKITEYADLAWTTLIPPTYIESDPGSFRIAINKNNDLALMNNHDSHYFVIKRTDMAASRSGFWSMNNYGTGDYSVFVTQSYVAPFEFNLDKTVTSYGELYRLSNSGRTSSSGGTIIGAIPVSQIQLLTTGGNNDPTDSLQIKVVDINGTELHNMDVTMVNSEVYKGAWKAYYWTSSGMNKGLLYYGDSHPLRVLARTNSGNVSGIRIRYMSIKMGYIFK